MPDRFSGPPPTLSFEDVTVRFAGVVALDSVSFSVQPGELHSLIGPNGAGKSTCFNVLSGIYLPNSGAVRLGEQLLTGMRPHRIAAAGIARAFQNVVLSKRQTVREHLMLGRHHITSASVLGTALGLPSVRREFVRHMARVEEIADFMDLTDVLDAPAGTLPYGDQKRVDIARAVAMEPRILVLDEPAAGMDGGETRHITQLIKRLREDLEMSIVLIEHDMGLVMNISDTVTVLDFGRLVTSDTPREVQADPRVIRAYLGGLQDTDTPARDTKDIENRNG